MQKSSPSKENLKEVKEELKELKVEVKEIKYDFLLTFTLSLSSNFETFFRTAGRVSRKVASVPGAGPCTNCDPANMSAGDHSNF